MPIQPIYLKIGPNWQCYLAGTYKTALRILIFSIAMGTDYSFYVKSIATFALTFFGYLYYFSRSQCGQYVEMGFHKRLTLYFASFQYQSPVMPRSQAATSIVWNATTIARIPTKW